MKKSPGLPSRTRIHVQDRNCGFTTPPVITDDLRETARTMLRAHAQPLFDRIRNQPRRREPFFQVTNDGPRGPEVATTYFVDGAGNITVETDGRTYFVTTMVPPSVVS